MNASFNSSSLFNSLPLVTFAGLPALIGIEAEPVQLLGVPSGGRFSGPGIKGQTFDPAIAGLGRHEISYSYTGPDGISNSETRVVLVETAETPVILIPVKRPVAKFLTATYGEEVHVSSKNWVGQLMLCLDIDIQEAPVPEGDLVFHRFRFAMREVRREYTEHKAALWAGTFCWSIFANTMLTWVDAQTQAGLEAKQSLAGFLDSYGITEEDYSLDSAYRYWTKYRPQRV